MDKLPGKYSLLQSSESSDNPNLPHMSRQACHESHLCIVDIQLMVIWRSTYQKGSLARQNRWPDHRYQWEAKGITSLKILPALWRIWWTHLGGKLSCRRTRASLIMFFKIQQSLVAIPLPSFVSHPQRPHVLIIHTDCKFHSVTRTAICQWNSLTIHHRYAKQLHYIQSCPVTKRILNIPPLCISKYECVRESLMEIGPGLSNVGGSTEIAPHKIVVRSPTFPVFSAHEEMCISGGGSMWHCEVGSQLAFRQTFSYSAMGIPLANWLRCWPEMPEVWGSIPHHGSATDVY